ncbi:PREDICTED: uncharacterized protein LOC106149636, partial [Chinchilla lanigera]|uniref:uncharacterized protein LOC106149636 n=1 Tax=Chinchilla lanigera TaxID=34839 RepID=UPI0006977B18
MEVDLLVHTTLWEDHFAGGTFFAASPGADTKPLKSEWMRLKRNIRQQYQRPSYECLDGYISLTIQSALLRGSGSQVLHSAARLRGHASLPAPRTPRSGCWAGSFALPGSHAGSGSRPRPSGRDTGAAGGPVSLLSRGRCARPPVRPHRPPLLRPPLPARGLRALAGGGVPAPQLQLPLGLRRLASRCALRPGDERERGAGLRAVIFRVGRRERESCGALTVGEGLGHDGEVNFWGATPGPRRLQQTRAALPAHTTPLASGWPVPGPSRGRLAMESGRRGRSPGSSA